MGLLRRPLSLGKGGKIVLDGEEIQNASAAELRQLRGKQHRHDLPGADDGPQPAVAGRPPDRRDVRAARGRVVERGDGPRRGRAAPGARALARAAHPRLSAPAFRRHAPARHDRHCAGLRPRPADRRRADHGARRHGAGRDHRPDGRALRRQGHRHPDDQPRSRPGRQHVPARRRDVCRPHRRKPGGRRRSSPRRSHPYTQGLVDLPAAARRTRAARPPAAARDLRRRALDRRLSSRLPLQSALPVGDRHLPLGRARTTPLPSEGVVRCHHHGCRSCSCSRSTTSPSISRSAARWRAASRR